MLYTLGYAAPGAADYLEIFMAVNVDVILLDIRLRPFSRYRPAFRKSALEARFEGRYHHIPELGNVNYRDRLLPRVLADPVAGLSCVRFWLDRGYSVCLLCACKDVESCHRSLVARLVQECFLCMVVHL